MPGDYTRFTFNPFEDHFGVLMQQGRVMLDSDFNEWVETLGRQFRVRMLDTVGRCVVPRETPEGFRIQIVGNSLTIGRGRAYVHGLLAENHGADDQGVPVENDTADALEYDPILEERRGVHAVAYESQPYLPNASDLFPVPPEGGPHLVYLDVWQREVTHVQEPDLVEKAVGVDTATRVQIIWQVKVLPNLPGGTTCATPDEDIPDWLDIIQPPTGRLTTAGVGVPASDDPCIIGPAGGFRGTENRLYRVEVHEGGPVATATFKWSRDNASVKTSVVGINGAQDVLTVSRIGRDAVRRFAPDDWIEVIDDHLELAQQPGAMRKVLIVDEVNETITLDTPLPAAMFNQPDPGARHTRIRRWDQKGQVLDATNTVIDDVDANGGVIKISAGGGTMVLEDGVQVTFTEDPAGGQYRTGDYWVFAARTVDASVEKLVEAPPRGIIHHYCRLALVTFPAQVDDCRTFWPPEFGEQDCYCTECVSADSHNSGNFTIQMAIDRVRAEGGKVCLGPGIFNLGNTPVQISGAQSIQVEGHGWRTILLYTGDGAAVGVTGSIGVDLSAFSVLSLATGNLPNLALAVFGSALVRVERCLLAQFGGEQRSGTVVGLSGLLIEVTIRDNLLFGASGIASFAAGVEPNTTVAALPGSRTYTLTLGLCIEDNVIAATERGISLEQLTLHFGETHISGNRLFGNREVGILAAGLVVSPVLTSSRVDIKHNNVTAQGTGIAFATDNTRLTENDIGVFASSRDQQQLSSAHGILLLDGLFEKGIEHVQILSNRIAGVGGDAIKIQTSVTSAMIKQNLIEEVGGGGIVMDDNVTAEVLTIENNHLLKVNTLGGSGLPVSAIRVFRAQQVTVANNTIDGFALLAVENPRRVAIEVIGSTCVRISGNDLRRIGPSEGFVRQGAGIEVWSPFDRVDVTDNSVRRDSTPQAADNSLWQGVVIRGPIVGRLPGIGDVSGAAPLARAVIFPLAKNEANTDFVLVGDTYLAILPKAAGMVAVRGNLVEGYGNASATQVSIQGSAVFSDNRCLFSSSSQFNRPVVDIDATSAITCSNQIERTPRSDGAVALDIAVGDLRFTVLGNICVGGVIRVNGGPLQDPWAPLNVLS